MIKFSLKKDFYDSWKYLKGSINYVYASALIFIVGAFLGFFMSSELGFLDEMIKVLIAQTQGLQGMDIISFIFRNNLEASLFSFVFGVILGIFPFLVVILNGVLLGYVFDKVVGVSGVWELWRILPHGIFELPAIFISVGLGLKLGMFIFSKEKAKSFKERLYKGFNVFVLIVIPLLVVAAFIEGLLITFLK